MNVDTVCVERLTPRTTTPRWLMSVLRALGTVLVAGIFTLLLVACVREFMQTRAPDALGVVIVNALFVFLYVTRSDPKAVSVSPMEWGLSFAGTTLPLLMRPSPGGFESIGLALQIVGLIVITVALISLSRSFGVVPANRGVRKNGLYRVVRHPLYAGEIIFIAGFVLLNPSLGNIVLSVGCCALQICRARVEERFLGTDPEYRSYCEGTRYRLLPFVF